MPFEDFELSKEDPIVKKFVDGLDSWERPIRKKSRIRTRSVPRLRGATAKAVSELSPDKQSDAFLLADDDPIVQTFQDGLNRWEKPFNKK